MRNTHLEIIDAEDTFWQNNWYKVYPPDKAAQVCTNDCSRLWTEVKVEDETGHLRIFMRERAALSLAGTYTK